MESKEGSTKKLIRIHLNAHRLGKVKAKAECSAKSFNHLQTFQTVCKSPDAKIVLKQPRMVREFKNGLMTSQQHLPLIRPAALESTGNQSIKFLFETSTKIKS